MKLKPLGDRVVLKVNDKDEVTASGLIIPPNAQEQKVEGEVVAIGAGRLANDGSIIPMSVKVGEKVIFGKYAGTEVKDSDNSYLIVVEADILAVVVE